MHHTLRFYGRYQHGFLRAYISLAKLSKVPVIGGLARLAGNWYARNGHRGYLLTAAEAEQIVDSVQNIALGPCSCRQVFHNCDSPVMNEIVLGTGVDVFRGKDFRKITGEEAKAVIRRAHESRLTHNLMECGDHFYALCNCCTCCCVPTRLRQEYGIGSALIRKKDIVAEFRRHELFDTSGGAHL